MTLAFVTNCIHHHQIPLADEFYKLLGEQYKYIATEPLPNWLIKGGYDPTIQRPYLIRYYEGDAQQVLTKKIINESDVVIFGAAPEKILTQRIQSNKLTFHYSERWFKEKPWYMNGIEGWKNYYLNHIRHRKKNLYMLAASAYTANDTYAIGCYKNKVYKWGYFTKVEDSNLERPHGISNNDCIRLLWCARFLHLKHPELPIQLAKKLKDAGYAFHLDMIGSGEKFEDTMALADSLDVCDVVTFLGNMPNEQVLQEMRNHKIFLFTSDKNEGWGAVLNEAMSNGCAVVASHLIGAAPFLIENGENGLLYKSEDLESLFFKVKLLMDAPEYTERIAIKARDTMQNTWNPKVAAERFIQLTVSLLEGKDTPFTNGPCSKAVPCVIKITK